MANTPNLDRLIAKYPNTHIATSGMAVGLPEGQMGNSEVGHTNIGAGRIVYQELTRITKEIHKKFTGHGPTNIASFQYSENYVSTPSRIRTLNQTNLMQNNIVNNLDSSIGSLQRSSANSQSIGAYGSKWKTNTNSTYNKTIKTNLTGEGYCTCDDAKESSNGCTCYKRNTNNTLNKTLGSNDQNIYIQEGSSTDYCNCDEKKIFSNSNSEYNENTHNVLTHEELNMNNYCTCG